jgi:putative MFS transporter
MGRGASEAPNQGRGNMRDSTAAPSAGEISARIDRLPATRTIWNAILLLSFGMFFELYDLLFSGYIAPSLVKSGLLTQTTPGLFGTTGVASFIAALFTGLFIGTILCGFLADWFGRRTIFVASLLWYTAGNLMVAMQSDAFGLNLWRLISGVGLGLEMVTIGAYLSEIFAARRSRARRRSASAPCRSFPRSLMFSCRSLRSAWRAGAGWCWSARSRRC